MPSSATAASLSDDDERHHSPVLADPSSDGSDSEGIDKNDDDEDPEEIEEEQEDGEEEETEVGYYSSNSPIATRDDQKDVSQDMEFKGHEKHLRSGSSTLGKPEVSLPSNTLVVQDNSGYFKVSGPSNEQMTAPEGESCMNDEVSKYPKLGKHLINSEDSGIQESAVVEKDAGALQEKKSLKDGKAYCDSKAHLSNSEIMDAETTKPSNVTGEEVAVARSKEANGVLYSEEGIKQMDMQSEEDIKQRASRLAAPLTRLRSLSPDTEVNDGNKRTAITCEFFAKGWCIKGTSCKFLHKKDHLDYTGQQPEGAVAAANCKSELLVDEGLRDGTGRSSLSGFHDSPASSMGRNNSSSESIPPGEHGAGQRWHQLNEKHKFSPLQREDLSSAGPPDSQLRPSSKESSSFISSFKDVGRESLRQNRLADDYSNYASPINKISSPVFRNSIFPDYGSLSSGSVISSSTYRSSGGPSSHVTSREELASKRSQFSLNDHTSPVLSRYLNSGSTTSLLTTSMLPSNHFSSWTGSSLCYSSSSLHADPLDAQKLLESDREFHASRSASLLQSSSPFSGSEPEIVPLSSVGHKTKISSNDWEPSVPFRPSFFIAPSISSPGSQYDPLRDSIEQPNIVGGSFKSSSHSQGASIMSTSQPQIYGDPVLSGTFVPEYNVDRRSISFYSKIHDNVLDKNFYAHGKDLVATEAEDAGFSVSHRQNRNAMPKEEKPLGPTHVNDISKTNRIDIVHDRRHQSDGARHKKESRVNKGRLNNEMDVDQKTDGDVHKESKALRHFRAALVDSVKELLKPTWREGLLSKDAHNMIVKRAVDKVLSTLQPHQIPSTMESIKQFLSSSRPKIAKLVEGYVDKYGKS